MRIIVFAAFSAMLSPAARAEEPREVDEIVVFGRAIDLIGEAKTGSEGVVGYSDLEMRPLSRVGELVEVIPGLVATQHSGTGKANQYFLRGFNLDHGTDFAAFVDGAPVNFRSHGHGQGYLDLNFIIPELVERVEYRKGPYFADDGDFAAAGTARFITYDALPAGVAEATIGSFGYRRGLIAKSFGASGGDALLAAEATFTDSPYILDEELQKFNGFAKFAKASGSADWSLSLSAYDASWRSTDQIPLRAVESGLISRLGFIDPDLGGETTRISINGEAAIGGLAVSAYALYYDFALFSNFTYFLADPVNGDEFEQVDARATFGGSAAREWPIRFAGRSSTFRVGGDIRHDEIFTVGLFNTAGRQRLSAVRDDRVREFSTGAFAEFEVALTGRVRAVAVLRGDFYAFDVEALQLANSGDGSDAILSPKAALAWRVRDELEFYANYGRGFHSNDVRGATIAVDPVTLQPVDPVEVLVRAEGAEVGARFERGPFNAALVGYWLDLDSELVFVGDAGTTEPNDATRRFGIEANAFWRPADWIVLDASAAYTDARFKDAPSNADRIPQSVGTVFGGGVTMEPLRRLTATFRVRHFGAAPLIEDSSVRSEPTTIVNFGVYHAWDRVRLGIDALNLLDSEDADISYFYESRLPGEAAPVGDLHFHPIEPRQIRGSLRIAI